MAGTPHPDAPYKAVGQIRKKMNLPVWEYFIFGSTPVLIIAGYGIASFIIMGHLLLAIVSIIIGCGALLVLWRRSSELDYSITADSVQIRNMWTAHAIDGSRIVQIACSRAGTINKVPVIVTSDGRYRIQAGNRVPTMEQLFDDLHALARSLDVPIDLDLFGTGRGRWRRPVWGRA